MSNYIHNNGSNSSGVKPVSKADWFLIISLALTIGGAIMWNRYRTSIPNEE